MSENEKDFQCLANTCMCVNHDAALYRRIGERLRTENADLKARVGELEHKTREVEWIKKLIRTYLKAPFMSPFLRGRLEIVLSKLSPGARLKAEAGGKPE